MDRAVSLIWRPRHNRDACIQHVVASEFQEGMSAAEQPREYLFQAVIDPVKRLAEPGPGRLR